jgi:hypothetical protein
MGAWPGSFVSLVCGLECLKIQNVLNHITGVATMWHVAHTCHWCEIPLIMFRFEKQGILSDFSPQIKKLLPTLS